MTRLLSSLAAPIAVLLLLARGAACGSDLFATTAVWRIAIELPADAVDSLRRDSRADVRAVIREGTNVWRDAALHLKGSKGSFQPISGKPSFTVDFDEFVPGQRFHGLSKLHLNNSAEDASYLHEKLGAELFRAAGVPAPRVAHAAVTLNGRRLGLYVLKEGFAAEFLAQHFARTDGNLYDPGVGGEITDGLRRSSGSGEADGADLRRLADAALEPDVTDRWRRLGELIDMERFTSFMAMEVLSGHRDGYCLARNNYRLYHDPAAGRFVFLPAGMDQLFGRADLPVHPRVSGMVAQAVMNTPEGRLSYRRRVEGLFTNVLAALTNRVREWSEAIAGKLPRGEARELRREAADLSQRIRRRAAEVERQLALPEPAPLSFTNGVARLKGWRIADEPAGGKLDQSPAPDGRAALHLRAGPVTSASWRAKVRLAPGRYRFEGQARTASVKALPFGRNHGASLSISGSKASPSFWLTGDAPWTKLEVEFQISGSDTEVDLLCALRASAGEAWFDAESLRLVKLP